MKTEQQQQQQKQQKNRETQYEFTTRRAINQKTLKKPYATKT